VKIIGILTNLTNRAQPENEEEFLLAIAQRCITVATASERQMARIDALGGNHDSGKISTRIILEPGRCLSPLPFPEPRAV